MFENLKLRKEVKSYERYVALNRARKAAEAAAEGTRGIFARLFDKADEIRRTIGYVK